MCVLRKEKHIPPTCMIRIISRKKILVNDKYRLLYVYTIHSSNFSITSMSKAMETEPKLIEEKTTIGQQLAEEKATQTEEPRTINPIIRSDRILQYPIGIQWDPIGSDQNL
jgi:hypothetical protein